MTERIACTRLGRLFLALATMIVVLVPQIALAVPYWTEQSLPATTAITSIKFNDDLHGWIQGFPRSFVTTDGGATWAEQSSDTTVKVGPGSFYRGAYTSSGGVFNEFPDTVSFIDSQNGWGAGTHWMPDEDPHERAVIWRTYDGGLHWTMLCNTMVETWGTQQRVGFFDSQNGYAVLGFHNLIQAIYRTSDGGLHWNKTADEISDVNFTSPLQGWRGMAQPEREIPSVVSSTSDGGASWTKHAVNTNSITGPADCYWLDAPQFFDASHGVVCGSYNNGLGDAPYVGWTENGGSTWKRSEASALGGGPEDMASQLTLAGTSTAFAQVGDFDRYWVKSGDKGMHWTIEPFDRSPESPAGIAQIAFSDANNGWAVNADGSLLLHTAVGGTPSPAYRPSVSTPSTAKTMGVGKRYSLYGYLKPKYEGGEEWPVRIKCYKKNSSGVYKYHHTVFATVGDYSDYSKYRATIRLPHRGRWRLRAYALAEWDHGTLRSAHYRYVVVK